VVLAAAALVQRRASTLLFPQQTITPSEVEGPAFPPRGYPSRRNSEITSITPAIFPFTFSRSPQYPVLSTLRTTDEVNLVTVQELGSHPEQRVSDEA